MDDAGRTECERLRDLLPEHAEGLLGAGDADFARDHLAVCSGCRSLREEQARGFAAMDAWGEEPLPAGAFERLQARLAARSVPPAEVFAPAFAGETPAPVAAAAPARRWGAMALAYASGLATAAVVVVAAGLDRGPSSPPSPAAGPGAPPSPSVAGTGIAAGPAGVVSSAPRVLPVAAPLPGERPLRFDYDDHERGVRRRWTLPRTLSLQDGTILEVQPASFTEDEATGNPVR